ncbi:MAG TPA: hypothetical protein VIX17_11815 [Pyrinomonadaceae bacterium]|jgi:hypothetical protein
MQLLNKVLCTTLVSIAILTTALGQKSSRPMKQAAEVVKAYRVCEQFQKILSQNLDFNAAFEQTFTGNTKRQRAIAIKDGEFEGTDFATVDDQTLIKAYKSRMQLVYLMLPLASPSDEEEVIFFPVNIKAMFTRKAPGSAQEFASFASQLERDASDFRSHLDDLTTKYPSVAERIRKFKSALIAGDFRPPKSTLVKPLKYDGGGQVLTQGESYYQIEGYTVVREGDEMRIAGIRFFTRLF